MNKFRGQQQRKKHKRKYVLAAMALAVLILFTAACGSSRDGDNAGMPGGAGSETEKPDKLMDQGYVIQHADGRLFVTALLDRDGSPFVDAYSLRITENTVFEDASGQTLQADDVVPGMQVEVWAVGPIAESYPAQGEAARVVVLADPDSGEGNASRSASVRAALEHLGEDAPVPAVQAAEWDGERNLWLIRIVHQQALEEPMEVKVDGASGRVIAADNEAFRIFVPEPLTVVGSPFAVEGKARVFEAEFQWTLEDGHVILAEGTEMADGAAPEWGDFRFEVSYEQATQENLMLFLYSQSAKDGSAENELIVPLKASEELIDYRFGVQ